MARILTKCAVGGISAVAFAFLMSWSGDMHPASPADLFTQAHAVIGRPLTPMSYAGVARRTTRRAVAVGAGAYGAYPAYVAPAPVYVAPAPVVVAPAPVVVICNPGNQDPRCPH